VWLWDDYRSEIYNNVYLKISEDGGLNWGNTINVTNLAPIDTNCLRAGLDIRVCNGDTLCPWIDSEVMFDDRDICHVAWSAWPIYYWWPENDSVGPWSLTARPSNIWHWDEQRHEYNIIAERWYGYNGALGVNTIMCQRPSFAMDTVTHRMYCSYQMHDSSQWNQDGRESGDAWVTVSTDYGRTWAQGVNVTNTVTPQDAPPPTSMDERDITIAKYVSGGFVHMNYQIDHDCGTAIATTPEGVTTLNEMVYQRIPINLIPARPLINPYRAYRSDSTGYPRDLDTTEGAIDERGHLQPGQFALYQNYPNPFNPNTTIQFDLASEMKVSLRVFDVVGREVAVVMDHQSLSAGAHILSFDGSKLASGVYFYRLDAPALSQTKKMVLMK
jgi:hypothetical protein